ncbi:MAG TPA: chitinase [Candidatus Angelobacter sp.]|nr:chitinase [Candidatus Angelobacter sp.]
MSRYLAALTPLVCLSLMSPLAARPAHVFAPYVDMTKITLTLPQLQAASGTKVFTLAFLVSGKACEPAWGGTAPIASDTKVATEVSELRKLGGDVILAFGGYDGLELAQTCTDVATLQAAYQAVVDKYKPRVLDLDIEHTAIEDPVSIDRRSQALTALAAANPGLQINYTLPATPAGLTDLSVSVIKSAVKFVTPIAVVNLMTMDYGAPVLTGAMGPDAVAAASGAACQLKSLGLNAHIGITPMIGVNDSAGELFTLDDAKVVVNYALANGNSVALVSFWSIGRDNGSCFGKVSPLCSGIPQKDWDFAHIFQTFAP